jgi:protein involved in polysaccharide export with SLBB domain
MNDTLKTEHAKLDAREALRSSPNILLGVSTNAAAALKLVEIESVFDLATSRLFANASQILSAGLDPKNTYYRFGTAPKDVVNAGADGHRVDELRFEGIAILDGLDAPKALTISQALDVLTVRDLALWPPYLAARLILNDAYLPELAAGFDPEAPADLLPKAGEYPTERVFYHTLVLDQVGSEPNQELERAGPIDIAPALDQTFGFKHLGIGALLTISQSWYAEGVALGQLLHSTALAPGESTRIAMMDWARRTKAGSTETISEAEQLDNETMHSRSLSEVTKAVANEAQEGFSSANNSSTAHQSGKSSGSATINADPLNVVSLGLFGDDPGVTTGGTSESDSTVNTSGMTFTSSSGHRSLEASTTQKVMDRTQQHANSVRNRRASIIREVSQEEHQSVSTRVVTNYNHMHALSIQYYEVVQIYRVEVGISDVEKCIFIPMKLIDFTQPVIDKYRLVLARSAVDRNALELLTTRYGVVEVMPQTPRITRNKLLDRLIKVGVAQTVSRESLFSLAMDVRPAVEASAVNKPALSLVAKEAVSVRPSFVDVLAAKGYDLAQIDHATQIIGRGLVRPNSDSLFLPDDAVITGLMVRDGVVTQKQAKVRGESTIIGIGPDGVSLTQSLPITDIESVLLTSGKEETQTISLVLQCNYLGVVFPLSIKVQLAGGTGAQEVMRFGSVRASKDLIDHLNANKLHYSQGIYRSLDASSLALLLSPYIYKGKPLVQLIDPTPVTITGNYLVFKMHEEETEPGPRGEETLSEWGHWLKDHGISKSRIKTEFTPLPSGGVFAEAVLGRYNAAEKLDMTRFWNWQDSPIPFAAPEIAPVEMTSRGAADDLKPGQLGAPVVSIVNPTPLPDPTGMAAVLQAIQNGNMFRDMSGLAATMGLAQAGINAASQGATAAGAQAGSNAATAAQLLSDLAKTAASVMTMGVGGAAGGLLGSSSGGGNGNGNISNAGALMNQGRSLTQRSGGASGGARGGSGFTRTPAGGGSASTTGGSDGISGGGGASTVSGSGSADLETQAFNRALWGQPGESQSDMLRGLIQPASLVGTGPASDTTNSGGAVPLAVGQIVYTEIRAGEGGVESYSHEYPIEPSGKVRIPLVAPVSAQAKTLTELRDAIANAIVTAKLFKEVTVNLTVLSTRVDYANIIKPGEKLFLRILENDGKISPSSGAYVVDNTGSINIPFLGLVKVAGAFLVDAQTQIEQGLIVKLILKSPVVHVTRTHLD